MYFAPHHNDDVLTLDTETRTASSVPTEQTGNYKGRGAATAGGAVYFAPHDNDNVLEMDPARRTTSTGAYGTLSGYYTVARFYIAGRTQ